MFHKEGFKIIRNTTISLLIINGIAWYIFDESIIIKLLTFTSRYRFKIIEFLHENAFCPLLTKATMSRGS